MPSRRGVIDTLAVEERDRSTDGDAIVLPHSLQLSIGYPEAVHSRLLGMIDAGRRLAGCEE